MWKRPAICLPKLAGGFRALFPNIRRTSHPALLPQERSISHSIDHDDLFRYSSGRWLVDEKQQLEQRFVKFNVERLCREAVSLFRDATKCVRVVKVEGNFNKAFLLTMDDGSEVIAKLPCRNTGTRSLVTASEVATLQFLKSRTSIHVPEVFAWSADPENPIGSEYILMEKIQGVALAGKWGTMNLLERYKVIDQIVEMEKELGSLEFPAFGSLYLRDSLPPECRHYPLPMDLDPNGLYCLGPSCNQQRWDNDRAKMSGPWPSFLEFALSFPQRELDSIGDPKSELHRVDRFGERPSLKEYKLLLQKAIDILPILSRDPRVVEVAGPTLWHTDLHLGNIFVSPDDPTTILGIIDWQSSQVGPLFIQARFPEFLKPPKHYYPGTKLPTLPDNFDDLDSERKEQATKENILASQSKYYEMSSLANNKRVYDALKLDRRIWEPFTCCRRFSNGSMVPLRNSMIRISQDWTLLGLPGNCPFSFTEEELRRHNEQAVQYQDMLYLWDIVKTQLSTDDSGWVPVERWKKTNEINRSLFDMYVETMSEKLSLDAALKKWPFPPNDL
ncbi:phosphotransferase family protein, PKc-like superfamily domain-containing protein [Histoplasma capsulatum var. duboisii H88]|uniref:Altered inheritance of mitochondria protein 9, mitochondrial n=1 Tax=Ajellomyces capsulatus (strain H88) TaxID=544711 RepID=A0A8A1LPC4_AJEC8|nr:phosphotransferase family protein, PKc-like superfamily domain-containing protein [Histoplasma capsulatum var. duboisii H88]